MSNSLKPQPGQSNSYNPKFKPLPGELAKQQLEGRGYQEKKPVRNGRKSTELQKALAAERAQHEASMKEQGVIPGKAVYEDPRQTQNTLLPRDR